MFMRQSATLQLFDSAFLLNLGGKDLNSLLFMQMSFDFFLSIESDAEKIETTIHVRVHVFSSFLFPGENPLYFERIDCMTKTNSGINWTSKTEPFRQTRIQKKNSKWKMGKSPISNVRIFVPK